MVTKKFKTNDSFIVNALRHCGYNSYSAIADIIDNSLEPEVESTFVKVDFETEGTGASETTIKSILIIDDGCGMDADILEEAMSLGSRTGKNGLANLGVYGAGMKTASFSIAQKLEVFTKTEDGQLLYALISLENIIANEDEEVNVAYEIYEPDSEQYQWFLKKVGKEHGTIIKLSTLDRLSNKNYYSFKGTLKNKLSELFNKFILANNVKFYVGKDEVPYVDLMGNSLQNDLMGEGTFEIDNHQISYKAWYIPPIGGVKEDETDKHMEMEDGTQYTNRTASNQGLYIFRNNQSVKSVVRTH